MNSGIYISPGSCPLLGQSLPWDVGQQMHIGLSVCPLVGFALLLGLIILVSIRSRKAGAIGMGVLAVCVLAGLALFTFKVQVSPAGSSVGYSMPWSAVGARMVFVPVVAAVFLGVIGLIAWGFARNPKKGFAVIGGLLLSLFLIGILVLAAAILLPALSRARELAKTNKPLAVSPVAPVAPVGWAPPTTGVGKARSGVLDAPAQQAADAIMNDPWVTAVASSNQVPHYACRELACAALTREVIARLRNEGRIAGDAGPRFVLTMEAGDPTTFETWTRMEPAIRAGIRAELQERAEKLVQTVWDPGPVTDAPEREHLLNGALLRWSEGPPQAGGMRSLTAKLFVFADMEQVRLVRSGVQSLNAILSGVTTIAFGATHRDKSWVLGTEWPSGRSGPFLVGRSQPMGSAQESRQTAEQEARRQLAERIRGQLAQVIRPDSPSTGPDALLEQAEKLIEAGASLAEQAGGFDLKDKRATAVVRGPAEAARTLVHAVSAATSSLRRESNELTERASRTAAGARGRDTAALAESHALSQSAQALVRQAEALEAQMKRVSAGSSQSTSASGIQAETFAASAKKLRQEAARIREQATRATAARSDRETANAYSDARLARADVVAARAVANAGFVRLDDYTQMLTSPSSGVRAMTAILLDASPATIDTLVSEALTVSASSGSGGDEIPRPFVTIGALLAIIVLAYVFLTAGRYGFFKWPIRVGVAISFAALCLIVMRLLEAQDKGAVQTGLLRAFSAAQASPSLTDRLVALARTSADGVAKAVSIADSANLDADGIEPLDRLVCGEYLLLGGYAERAAASMVQAMRQGGKDVYYRKSLGWALLRAGRDAEARQEFSKVAGNRGKWTAKPITNGSIDNWTAAYFLDLVSQTDYADCWKTNGFGECMACFPWFYVGQRMEIEGKRDEAVAAYRKSVELGKVPGAHYIRNWSAYRLGVLAGVFPAPSSRPSQDVSADRADSTD